MVEVHAHLFEKEGAAGSKTFKIALDKTFIPHDLLVVCATTALLYCDDVHSHLGIADISPGGNRVSVERREGDLVEIDHPQPLHP